jgi:Malate synthase
VPSDEVISALAKEGIEVLGPVRPPYDEILTPDALRFVASLQRAFGARREELLARRVEVQKRIDAGVLPDFLPETVEIRRGDWNVAPIPAMLEDRRVEITGPVERKMVINALNSGASVFLADFEDANSPTWANCVEGQANLRDAVDGTIAYRAPETGKDYRLNEKTAVLMVRPRGWHLLEKHLLVDGKPCSGSLFDFGLFSSTAGAA